MGLFPFGILVLLSLSYVHLSFFLKQPPIWALVLSKFVLNFGVMTRQESTMKQVVVGVENLLKCHKAVTQKEAQKLSEEAGANIILNALVSEADQVVTGKVLSLLPLDDLLLQSPERIANYARSLSPAAFNLVVWSLKSACSAQRLLSIKNLPHQLTGIA